MQSMTDRKNEIQVSVTRYHKFINYLCVFLQAGTFLYLLFVWNRLPDRIPTHYNGAGEIDGYGPRFTIWICPVAMILMYQLTGVVE